MFGPTLPAGTTKSGIPITLTQPDLAQVDALVSWLNDEEVMRYLNPAWEYTSSDEALATLQEFATNQDTIHWAIELEGRQIGAAWINEIDSAKKSGSLGVLIGEKSLWGAGIGTAVCTTVCNHAFGAAGLRSLHVAFVEENEGSRRIAQKLGFILEHGTAHFTDGKNYPGWDGVLTSENWNSTHNQAS